MLAVFCTNAINILAGINGLEVGQSVIIAFSVLILNVIELTNSFSHSHLLSLYYIVPFLAVSIPLLKYNWYVCNAALILSQIFSRMLITFVRNNTGVQLVSSSVILFVTSLVCCSLSSEFLATSAKHYYYFLYRKSSTFCTRCRSYSISYHAHVIDCPSTSAE